MNCLLLKSAHLQGYRQTRYIGVAAPYYLLAILNVDPVFSDLLRTKLTVIMTGGLYEDEQIGALHIKTADVLNMIAAWSCMLFLINGSHTSKNIL
jgi:hypothetical protein